MKINNTNFYFECLSKIYIYYVNDHIYIETGRFKNKHVNDRIDNKCSFF